MGAIYTTVFSMPDILVDQINQMPLPEDLERANRSWLLPLTLNNNAASLPAFTAVVDQFMADSQGNGVQKDQRKAVALSRQAAVLGHGCGQTNLGYAYFNGRGLVVNKICAYVWSDLGAWNGNDTGAKNRDLYMQSMSDSQISIAKELSTKCIRENYVDCF